MSENLNAIIQNLCNPLSPIHTESNPYSNLKKPIKLILFDIYGTLLISGTGDVGSDFQDSQEAQLVKDTFSQLGFDVSVEENSPITKRIHQSHLLSKSKGITFPEVDILQLWLELSKEYKLSTTKDEIQKLALYYECKINPVWPMPNLHSTLHTLVQELNLPLGIVSNAQFYTPILLSYFLNTSLWDFGFKREYSVFSYEKGFAKPEIQLFSDIQLKLEQDGILPNEVIYIGNDQLKDIYAAQQVGFQTILFAGDKRSLRRRPNHAEASTIKASAEISDLSEIPTLIQ